MAQRPDSVTVTLVIQALQTTKDSTSDVYVSWNRRGKSGSTKKKKVDRTHIVTFDESFPIHCNFKRKKDKWQEKIVNVELFHSTKKLHKWNVNLADLYSKDVLNLDVKCENATLGRVCLSIALLLGTPQKASQVLKPVVPRPPRAQHQRCSSVALNDFHIDEPAPTTDLTALRTKNAPPLPTPPRGNHRRVASTVIPSNVAAQLLDEDDNGLKNKIEDLEKNVRENGPKYNDGVPEFGIKVIDLFSEQPRGTSFVDSLTSICTSLCAYAQVSVDNALYSFMSLTCVYAGLKNYGWDSTARNYDMKDKIEEVFKNLIKSLCDIYLDDLKNNGSEGISNFLKEIKGDDFAEFLSKLLLYTVFAQLPPDIAKQRINEAEVNKASFFDNSLMNVNSDESVLIPLQKTLENAYEYIEDVPYPLVC